MSLNLIEEAPVKQPQRGPLIAQSDYDYQLCSCGHFYGDHMGYGRFCYRCVEERLPYAKRCQHFELKAKPQ